MNILAPVQVVTFALTLYEPISFEQLLTRPFRKKSGEKAAMMPRLAAAGMNQEVLVAEEGEVKVFVFSGLDCLTFPLRPV